MRTLNTRSCVTGWKLTMKVLVELNEVSMSVAIWHGEKEVLTVTACIRHAIVTASELVIPSILPDQARSNITGNRKKEKGGVTLLPLCTIT